MKDDIILHQIDVYEVLANCSNTNVIYVTEFNKTNTLVIGVLIKLLLDDILLFSYLTIVCCN